MERCAGTDVTLATVIKAFNRRRMGLSPVVPSMAFDTIIARNDSGLQIAYTDT